LVDEHATTYENPFKFSGKELDDITGLYDHGARSRDPKLTMWYGVDPLFEKYPDFSPYSYCMCNPVRFVDPDGRGVYKVEINGTTYYKSFEGDEPSYTENGLTWVYFSMEHQDVQCVYKESLWMKIKRKIFGGDGRAQGYGDGNGSDAPTEEVRSVSDTQDHSNFQIPIGDIKSENQKIDKSRTPNEIVLNQNQEIVVVLDTTIEVTMVPNTEHRSGYSITSYEPKNDTIVERKIEICGRIESVDTIYSTTK